MNAQQAGTDCVGKIPPTASALSLNVTALNATSNSFLTIWPDGQRPLASTLNPAPGQRVFNAVTTELTAAQTFQIYNNRGNVDVFVDIDGYYDNQVTTTGTSWVATVRSSSDRRLTHQRRVSRSPADLAWDSHGSTNTAPVTG